jgi:hypothetical protein
MNSTPSHIEILESRIAPAVILVNTISDGTGKGTLRYAITQADAASHKTVDTIVFAPQLAGETLYLNSPLPPITHSMTITGLGATKTVISGANTSSSYGGVFNIQGGSKVTISNLTIENGNAVTGGGAIEINDQGGNVVVNNSVLTKNSVTGAQNTGGGYYARGGAIDLENGSLTVSGSSVTGNKVLGGAGASGYAGESGYGGALYIGYAGKATIVKSTISGNSATGGAGIAGYTGSAGQYYNGAAGGTGGTGGSGYAGGKAQGGGIACRGSLKLTNSVVSGNTVHGGQGGPGGTGGIGGNRWGRRVRLHGRLFRRLRWDGRLRGRGRGSPGRRHIYRERGEGPDPIFDHLREHCGGRSRRYRGAGRGRRSGRRGWSKLFRRIDRQHG